MNSIASRTARGRAVRLAAWVAATAAAVTVCWFGVHRALADDTAAVPRALPVIGHQVTPPPRPTVGSPVTSRPSAAPPTATATATPTATASLTAAGPPAVSRPPGRPVARTPAPTRPTGDVRTYQPTGGRIVLELASTSARLVSAIPDAGWQVQAWQADGWLRVDFSRGGTTSSCFVTWNGHPPTVQLT